MASDRKAYFCNICYKTHNLESKIGKEHYPENLKEHENQKEKKEKITDEERDEILYRNIFGSKDKLKE